VVGTPGTCGVSAFTSCDWEGNAVPSAAVGGDAVGDAGGAGGLGVVWMPGTFGSAGTRGNENKSFTGGNTGAAPGDVPFSLSTKYGFNPGKIAALPNDAGAAPTSAPAGGEVGEECGNPEMPGKENNSLAGGSVGGAAMGESFRSARNSGGDPGTGGVGAVPGAPDTTAVAPASEAAIARRSVSVNGPSVVEGIEPGRAGDHSTAGTFRLGTPSGNVTTGISSASTSAGGCSSPLPFAKSRGNERKNSLASLSMVAGSGKGIEPKG